ncbi:hypothetical protein ASPZODRAFT_134521 [Penicilliopsis zonata CBS 506.65]|uniref:Amine oxidase domain-containing protein n=1 Tax=Penicilliopsis zonata CBS 506.65 TaxID=1073090 RepID=A0A1L9SDA1_9EURO|nr:hypothetical protein ASPZODRAFT_134521 [Penicilliopsis zonata CBS 506.65]OJJ45093.1 hypothetical protein ASPZODRAFT_134521 [Penicilliopsis zonata CBS 506.65]
MPQKIAIIGAGAAGMSCAASLAAHPDRFAVTLVDVASLTGGQATSIPLDASQFGASWLNDGVQGGSPIFRHTFRFFRQHGHEPQPVQLQVAFGKGRDAFFTNVFPSPLIEASRPEILKLGRVLKCIKYAMPILGLVPVKTLLSLFRFSAHFGTRVVLPLLALFLGTGNQTPNVPCILLERLFDDPQMRLWEYDADSLLPNRPTMYTFPNLGDFYRDWTADLQARGVEVLLNTRTEILRRHPRDGVTLSFTTSTSTPAESAHSTSVKRDFDYLVLCTQPDESKNLLGSLATWKEKYVLGGVRFYNDLTITHCDAAYFTRTFETQCTPDLCVEKKKDKARDERIAFAQSSSACQSDGWQGFHPMYYTHSYANAPECIEMGFDCSNYQHQFRQALGEGNPSPPPDRHVYQTIFLDDSRRDLWTCDEIDADKVIARKEWHQFGHRWQHYLRVVPGMMFLNGKNRTFYAGSWTMVNMHEIACISGIAAAHRLGATYEPFDDLAEDLFAKYLLVCHGVRHKKQSKKQS